jgi:feruloyl esterase
MVEAERFPQDFDGVVAVAPVDIGPFGVSGTFGASNYVPPGAMNADAQGRRILSDLDIPMIYKAVMRACDVSDGVADGLFAPQDCSWDPISLACRPGASAPPHTCLSPPQVELVRRFYAKGAQRGSELNWIDNLSRAPGPQTQFADPRGDPVTAETLMNAGNPDLRVFKAHGGKLILAHGATDLIVLPGQTIDYYETATRVMGGAANTTDFFRLFLIPGMDHCSGGDGAWGVDYLAAATQWVETGKAPAMLTGVHPKPGVQLDYFGIDTSLLRPDQIAFSRPYYPYPLKAYYSGQGDPNAAASFIAGLRPIGKIAHADPGQAERSNASGAGLRDTLGAIMTTTEEAYKTSGLPSENITARIAKAMRRQLYLSDPPRPNVEAALGALLGANPSPLARPALVSLSAEYASPPS